MADIWFTILRWLILVGLAIGLVAVPTIYVNHRIDAAHQLGLEEGRAACVESYAKAAIDSMKKSEDRLAAEAAKALDAQAKAEEADRNANKLQGKLNDLLKKDPPVVATGCVLSPAITGVLREFATNGGDVKANGDSVSSPLAPDLSDHPAIPGQGNPRHRG